MFVQRCDVTQIHPAGGQIETPIEHVERCERQRKGDPGISIYGQDPILDDPAPAPHPPGLHLALLHLGGGQGLVGDIAQGNVFCHGNGMEAWNAGTEQSAFVDHCGIGVINIPDIDNEFFLGYWKYVPVNKSQKSKFILKEKIKKIICFL